MVLDFNSSKIGPKINHLIDEAILKHEEAQPRRDYLGGSRLGEECERMLQFEYFHTPKDTPFTPKLYRIFHRGHRGEDWCIHWLEMAGFTMATTNEKGEQFGFKVMNGKVRGHCDGIITAGPDFMTYPSLWECKTLGDKGWKDVVRHGVKKSKPVYYGQMQLYMTFLDVSDNPGVFTALNANTMELYHEKVEYDQEHAQELSDKAVRIIRASISGEQLPRPFPGPDFFKCKFCDYSKRCWED